MKAERLEREFAPRGVRHQGMLFLRPDDAIDLVRCSADEGVPIVAIEGLRAGDGDREVPLEHLADYSRRVAEGYGCWQEAEAFIRERAGDGLLFDLRLGDDPVEAV